MYVPEPVISLAIWTKNKTDDKNVGKALSRFQREDPTFRVNLNPETNQVGLRFFLLTTQFLVFNFSVYCKNNRRSYLVWGSYTSKSTLSA